MIIVRNDILPFKGYQAVTIWPFVFVRDAAARRAKADGRWEKLLNHEKIHGRQQVELLVIPFYLIYLVLWLFWSVRMRSWRKGYKMNPLEREAYAHESDLAYLKTRRLWAWVRKQAGDAARTTAST